MSRPNHCSLIIRRIRPQHPVPNVSALVGVEPVAEAAHPKEHGSSFGNVVHEFAVGPVLELVHQTARVQGRHLRTQPPARPVHNCEEHRVGVGEGGGIGPPLTGGLRRPTPSGASSGAGGCPPVPPVVMVFSIAKVLGKRKREFQCSVFSVQCSVFRFQGSGFGLPLPEYSRRGGKADEPILTPGPSPSPRPVWAENGSRAKARGVRKSPRQTVLLSLVERRPSRVLTPPSRSAAVDVSAQGG